MSITARTARTRMTATATLVSTLVDRLPQAVAAIHTAIADGDADTRKAPEVEDAGIRSKGGHSDPTGDAALALIGAHDRHLVDLEDNLATLVLATSNLIDLVGRWVPLSNPAPAVRCNGGGVVADWSRPDCTNWAAETSKGSGRLRGDGLCDACRVAKSRYERDQAAA